MENLNTTVVTASVSRLAGGTFTSVRRLHQALHQSSGVNVNVFGLQDKFTEADLESWKPLAIETFSILAARQFGYSPSLRRAMLNSKADIAHTHGIWMYSSVAVSNWHRQTRKPYLVSLHGMLDPWALKNSAWKKRVALMLYEREHLEHAACLRALCESEATSIRAFGLKNPICIIPNGIDLPIIPNAEMLKSETLKSNSHKVLLYLGRIHPKKGLVNLLKAWAEVRRSEDGRRMTDEWILAIAGWDQGGHEKELKVLCSELKVESSVQFLGPKFGDEKKICYQNCDAFILPSFSEGLPMVILEAWAYGKPVLMTPQCNLPEGFAANAAIRIESNVEGIANGLHDLLHAPCSALQSLGTNGRALVAARFTWPKIASEMKSVYGWVLGGGVKPKCVC